MYWRLWEDTIRQVTTPPSSISSISSISMNNTASLQPNEHSKLLVREDADATAMKSSAQAHARAKTAGLLVLLGAHYAWLGHTLVLLLMII